MSDQEPYVNTTAILVSAIALALLAVALLAGVVGLCKLAGLLFGD